MNADINIAVVTGGGHGNAGSREGGMIPLDDRWIAGMQRFRHTLMGEEE